MGFKRLSFKINIEWEKNPMGDKNLTKFSSTANPDILNCPHQLGNTEGCKPHTILDEAFRDYLNKKGLSVESCNALSHFAEGLQEFEDLYKELAK